MLNVSGVKDDNLNKKTSKPLVTPKEISNEEIEKSVSYFSIIAVIIVLVATAVFYGLTVYKKSQLKYKETVYNSALAKLNVKDVSDVDKVAQELQRGLAVLQNILGNQYNYSKLFQEIQKDTPKNVKLNNFSVDDKGDIKMDGEGGNYDAAAKTMASYSQSEMFSDVKLVSSNTVTTTNGSKVAFSLTMKLNKSQLKQSN
ncbi:MAG: PilN domain-containing protein [Patescibacteria group bacterium]|nr:PilN domain-containing protein [Patescibacteria group bacterium]